MSHLGIVSAISLASKGFDVIGVDIDSNLIEKLNLRIWPFSEPEIDATFKMANNRIQFSSDVTRLKQSEVIFISMDVPTDDLSNSNLEIIEDIVEVASKNISINAQLVILCQVPPGFTRKMKKYHANIIYQVETLVFGEAFNRSLNPERIIIGVEDEKLVIGPAYSLILKSFNCPIICMNYESAEFTKISINTYLATSIITTNSLNALGREVGAKWNEIVPALQLDRRIGKYAYLKPGLGISGGNIERDLKTLDNLAKFHNPDEESIFESYLHISQEQKKWILDVICQELKNNRSDAKVGILGIAYKENTNSTKNSIALTIAKKFANNIIGAYDPIALFPFELDKIKIYKTPQECISLSDIVVIATPWAEFSKLDLETILEKRKEVITFIDPHSMLDCNYSNTNLKIINLAC